MLARLGLPPLRRSRVAYRKGFGSGVRSPRASQNRWFLDVLDLTKPSSSWCRTSNQARYAVWAIQRNPVYSVN
jgi:hypothetical protein